MTDRSFPLRVLTAALSQDFPCKLIFKKTADRRGLSAFTPVLILELSEEDMQALQDVAGVGA